MVEANPLFVPKLLKNANSIVVHSAICDEKRTVHFYSHNHESGIVEFTLATEMQRSAMMKTAVKVECLPLGFILRGTNVTHVNFFVLDVEGAELAILNSVDWEYTVFDVLSVETEQSRRRPGYVEDVARFLLSKGYEQVQNIPGRNSWFTRVGFVPSRRPAIAKDCFSGALWATRWRNLNHTQQAMFKHCPAGIFTKDSCQNCAMF